MYTDRAKISGALGLHCLCALWQIIVIMKPGEAAYWNSHEEPELQWRMPRVAMLLTLQVVL